MVMIKLITARIWTAYFTQQCTYDVFLYYYCSKIYLTLVVQGDDILSGMQCVSL